MTLFHWIIVQMYDIRRLSYYYTITVVAWTECVLYSKCGCSGCKGSKHIYKFLLHHFCISLKFVIFIDTIFNTFDIVTENFNILFYKQVFSIGMWFEYHWTSHDLPSVTGDMFTDRSTYNMGTYCLMITAMH